MSLEDNSRKWGSPPTGDPLTLPFKTRSGNAIFWLLPPDSGPLAPICHQPGHRAAPAIVAECRSSFVMSCAVHS